MLEGQSALEQVSANADAAKSKRSSRRTRKRTSKKPKENGQKTKAVVRRLPPNLPEEVFKSSIDNWLPGTDWYDFVPGKLAKSKAKEHVFSRAYLHFKTFENLIEFAKAYGGHLFVDSRGNEHRAVVEFAPYQRVPKKRRKADPRLNTIDQDPDYLEFLNSLKSADEAESGLPTGESSLDKLENRIHAQQVEQMNAATLATPEKPKSTPLLDDLRAKKALKTAAQQAQKRRKGGAAGNAGNSGKASPKASPPSKKGTIELQNQQATQRGQKQQQQAKKQQEVSRPPSGQGGAVPDEPRQINDEPKKKPAKRLAPTGSLFKASIANVLGTPRVSKRNLGPKTNEEPSAVAGDATQGKAEPANSASAGGDQNEREGRGRGYRKLRQSRSEGIGTGTGGAVESTGQPESAAATPGDQQPGPTNDRLQSRPSLANMQSKDSLRSTASKPGEDDNAEGGGGGRSRRRRNRGKNDAGGDKEGEGNSRTSAKGERQVTQADPAVRTGPSVVIMRRDGTTSQFKVGGADAGAKQT
ncbi:hypothetical protein HK097_005552 [Rhizophlyctis rosea]|uniref:UPF3 domain-containing protein n=1 Tax=Rhizophlyctis rosea TaxID=64517 RepID=A0AAD5SKE1_9FUNG|nr:hypothetical protein HK097_005552 [Rhizophlyctis rosea]